MDMDKLANLLSQNIQHITRNGELCCCCCLLVIVVVYSR